MKIDKKMTFTVNIPVIFMREGKHIVAFSPALDVTTSASDFEEAKKRFEESVEIFFEELTEKGTLEEVLQELGWKKVNHQWEPPVIINQISKTVQVPALA
jgi:hypothetical protein